MEIVKPATPYQALKDLEAYYEEFRAALMRCRATGMGGSHRLFLPLPGQPPAFHGPGGV